MQSTNLEPSLNKKPSICRKTSKQNEPIMLPESLTSSEEAEDDLKITADGETSGETNESLRAWFEKITQIQNEIQKKIHTERNAKQQPTTRTMKYQDLPYMGEMTLDNSKPRRGRKPKKADICHLIYKNYGTIFPQKKSPNQQSTSSQTKPNTERSDVQNRIISSLLERRLTQQESRRHQSQSEPLNLCVRDLDHQLNLRLNLEAKQQQQIKSERLSDDEESPSPLNLPSSADIFPPPISPPIVSPQDLIKTSDGFKNGNVPAGYVYWPNAGVFIHQLALQQQLLFYQKMTGHNLSEEVFKSNSNTDAANDNFIKPSKRTNNEKSPATKRKRSAIFIPPIPTENQNNPATEVSICKFKFTGGAKPSLQEKKMLSVDSGGNFRYYSGTGDKSMRGYEFFPRETLQQQINNTQGSSTGAFLQASGEKIFATSPMDFANNNSGTTASNNDSSLLLSTTPEVTLSGANSATTTMSPIESRSNNKKRKSRKSLQREKLEQTFKEKGFLIQTQQLESAEGATYCKFRQLRKFTRYLFRSWKDYLPGNVADNAIMDGASSEKPLIDNEDFLDNVSELSSPTVLLDESPNAVER